MLCPMHGPGIIGPPCMRCVGEDARRERAEFAAHAERLGLTSVKTAKGLARSLRPALPSSLTMRRRGDVITLTVSEAESGAEQSPLAHLEER